MNYSVVENYEDLIKQCYSEDLEFIQNYHDLSETSLEICTEDTIRILKEHNSIFFEVSIDDELIGYFSRCKHNGLEYLVTFFIRPEFRKKEYLMDFWNLVKKEFSCIFVSGVYSSNQKAVKFLDRVSEESIDFGKNKLFVFNGR